MRLTDANVVSDEAASWEPWMGEPPAVFERPSATALVDAFERSLQDTQVLRLLQPEWLEHMPDAGRMHAAIAAFRQRGGVVEVAAGDA